MADPLENSSEGKYDPGRLDRAGITTNLGGKPLPAVWTQPIPGEAETTPDHVHAASVRLVAAGLSVIPIEAYEGTKAPDVRRLPHPHDPVSGRPKPSWSAYKFRRPTTAVLDWWYATDGAYGLAAVCGAVSGGQYGLGLEVIDFDTANLVQPWIDAVEQRLPGLVSSLVRVVTPRPGLHVYYRCSHFGVSRKLAFAPAVDDFGRPALDPQGRPVRTALVEVKAEGGYCLIPPSPPRCHPTGRLYRYAPGSPDLTAVPTITPEERAVLLNVARSLDRWQAPEPTKKKPKKGGEVGSSLRPGDDFNARGNWADILTRHGWTVAGISGDEVRWSRPDKGGGVSATTNHHGTELLHVFSSNASPFEADRSYTKFTAYALLNHGGDFAAAAWALSEQGYGGPKLKPGKR